MIKYWFALQADPSDDWGTGFADEEEAKRALLTDDRYNLYAVIEIWTDDNGREHTVCKQEVWRAELLDPAGWLTEYEETQEEVDSE